MGQTVNLLDSLLDAITRLEGEALVMHVGEKPYVVTTSSSMNAFRGPLAWGQVELSTRVLTSEAVLGMLGQILPLDQRQGLEEFGAIEYDIPRADPDAERFTVIAARGGDDVWLEVRRRHPQAEIAAVEAPDQPEQPEEVPVVAAPEVESAPFQEASIEVAASVEEEVPAAIAEEQLEEEEEEEPQQPQAQDEEEAETYELRAEELAEPETAFTGEPAEQMPADVVPEEEVFEISLEDVAPAVEMEEPVVAGWTADEHVELVSEDEQAAPTTEDVDALPSAAALLASPGEPVAAPQAEEPIAERLKAAAEAPAAAEVSAEEAAPAEARPSAVILPISRTTVRQEAPPAQEPATLIAPLEHMLRVAAARGASTVYFVAGSKPMIRVDGEISVLDAETVFAASDVERVVMELAPARGRDGNRPVEWMSEVPEVGRVRCVTFSDHRGPGIIFRMIPPRAISAEQLGLSAEVQALCAQPDGLVLVTGPRASGKSTLLSAFVDLINRTRSDHVITIESQIGFVHESRRSFVSQREVRGDSEAAAATVRSAFREDPDVLVIEDLRTPEIVMAALEAAESGRLVFGSLPASSTVAAIERLVELLPADRRSQAQSSLAASLRGVVAQVLLRKVKGGRIAAREVLLNTPSVAGLITEGQLFQLPVAVESGRRQGMVPLNESLAALVREGTVHIAEAYRKALDREGLLALFKRDGMDTSFAERLA